METLLREVVVVDAAAMRAFIDMDVHRAHVRVAIIRLAIAHDGCYAEPREKRTLITHVDGESLVVQRTGLVDVMVVLMLRRRNTEINLHTTYRRAETPAKTLIVGLPTGLAELNTKGNTLVVVGKIKELGIRAVAGKSKQNSQNNKSCFRKNPRVISLGVFIYSNCFSNSANTSPALQLK